jgi:hypothetical protein
MHTTCLKPPLTEVPEGDWFCAACVAKRSQEIARAAQADAASTAALQQPLPPPAPPPPPPEPIYLNG